MQLTQALHRAVALRPDGIATVCGNRRHTFTQFRDRVARLVGALRALGVGAGDRVGILSLNADRYVEAYMAIPWAGAACNPINTRWSSSEIAYSLDDCDTRVLLVDDSFVAMAAELKEKSRSLATLIHVGDQHTPDGMLSYETLSATHDPVPDVGRRGGGENVYSIEVEQAVAKHPAVAVSAVIGVPDPQWGERVHAVVVLKSGQETTAEDIREHCKTLIGGYKCPRSVEFVAALPMSGAGKVLKRALREPYWKGQDRGVS